MIQKTVYRHPDKETEQLLIHIIPFVYNSNCSQVRVKEEHGSAINHAGRNQVPGFFGVT
jgi:hypothetical protein